ncbi:MAG: hypothetical protein ACPF9D_08640, partial [Owenweeksia sp.]
FGSFDLEAIAKSLNEESGSVFHSAHYTLLKDRSYLILRKKRKTEDDPFLIHKNDHHIDEPVRMDVSTFSNHN